MVDLQRRSIAAQLGSGWAGHGVAVRLLDLVQFYLPCAQPPNSIVGDDPYTLWLAPDRALQVGGTASAGFVSDMTDGLAVFELSGPRADEIVAMGCTLGLSPSACAQTVFGGVRVVIYRHGAAIRVHVERQLADFLLLWFQTALSALQ